MKQSITLALTALFALAAAAPLEKREFTTTVFEDVTSTVDVYTTIYVSPGDPRLTLNEVPAVQTTSSAPAISVTPVSSSSTAAQTSSQAPIAAPQQKQEAQVQAPPPTSTPTPSVIPQPSPQPQVKAAAPIAPVAPVAPIAPVQSSPAPVFNQQPSSGSPPSSSGPTGGSCGEIKGKCTASDVTTFDGNAGISACGTMSGDVTPDYVALAVGMMGPQSNGGGNKNPYCDRKIQIKDSHGVAHDAIITDKCPGCTANDQSLDLSPSLFAKVFDGATTGRFHNIEWWFTS